MARTQAAEYDARREEIVDRAAELYAARGFLGASVLDLAKACGISKSLIYHYYPSTRDILFAVMTSHVEALLEAATAVGRLALPPREKLTRLNRAFLNLYAGAADRQTVLLNELEQLTPEARDEIVGLQRAILEAVERILVELRPALAESAERRAVTLLFFGMINWLHTWYDPAGRIGPEAMADLASGLFLDGVERGKV